MRRILVASVLALFGFLPGEDIKQFTDWSPPVNLGQVINSPYIDSCVAISKNGLSLFFSSTRQGSNPYSNALRDLYVSSRISKDDLWLTPEPLTMLNTLAWESCPALSLDEHRLYFTSNRSGGCGGQDIWVSRRQDRRNDLSWGPALNLGCEANGYVNTAAFELTPTFFEDEDGTVVMYFTSNRTGNWDHYQSVMRDDDTFGPATPVVELNGPYIDQGITVRRDGLEVFFLSNRRGDHTSMDFWRASRESTEDPWSEPVFVPSLGSPAYAQGHIALSFDGREIYFTSWNEPSYGWADLWVARREKVGGKH